MNYFENMNYMDQGNSGDNPDIFQGQDGIQEEYPADFQPENPEYVPDDSAGGDDLYGDTSFPDGEDIQNEEGDNGEESQSEKPKRKRRKKENPSSEEAQDGEDAGGEGELEASDFPFDFPAESDADEDGVPQEFAGNEGAEPYEPDGDFAQDAGAGLDESAPLPEDIDIKPPDGDEPDSSDTPARRTRRRQSGRAVVLDASGNVITQRGDSGQHDLSVLTAARNARRILTATVDGIEGDGESLPRVIFYHGTVKVMIPFSQMGFDLDPENVSQREARLLIDSMLGAKIDYMVRGVDTEARVAAGSRRDAMVLRQRTILNARGTSNEFRINEGMRVMARIIHVARQTVRVEVFGFESYVRIDSISNVWVNDIREVIQVGEERPVEIVSLQRDEAGRVVSMRVSMKAAEDAPQLELKDGNTYTGTISNFSDTAYFVRVAGIPVEVRCPIKSNHTMEMMNQGDFVKFYIRGIYGGVPTGAILKIIKRKLQPML